jgi:chloramphenicol-sensitive protein RarD
VGQFPWVALALAFSFAFYGLLRKTAPVGAIEGLSIETLLLFAPAAGYLWYLNNTGSGAFASITRQTDLLLVACALVTAVPLLLFTVGARRLSLITIGFLQYLAPSCTFLLAVFVYGEPFSHSPGVTFCLIWVALAIFSTDAMVIWKARPKPVTEPDPSTAQRIKPVALFYQGIEKIAFAAHGQGGRSVAPGRPGRHRRR